MDTFATPHNLIPCGPVSITVTFPVLLMVIGQSLDKLISINLNADFFHRSEDHIIKRFGRGSPDILADIVDLELEWRLPIDTAQVYVIHLELIHPLHYPPIPDTC